MGTREKFWFRDVDGRPWLFKYPRENTGEHWAEKIAASVASMLEIKHARVELAKSGGVRGSATASFICNDEALFHGNDLLEIFIRDYDPEAGFRYSSHTLKNILSLGPGFDMKQAISEYMVLDALIGNTDRHHENWGMICNTGDKSWQALVAPSFDHASSLGRELLDEKRNRLMKENRVGHYAERGHGAIYWSQDEKRGPSPLELVRRTASTYSDFFHKVAGNLEKIREDDFDQIIARIPSDWMTGPARQFAAELMRYNYSKLREVL